MIKIIFQSHKVPLIALVVGAGVACGRQAPVVDPAGTGPHPSATQAHLAPTHPAAPVDAAAPVTPAYPGAPPAPNVGELGGPRADLTAEQRAAFERGFQWFVKRWSQAEGHGPHFNQVACVDCHDQPVPGGGRDLSRKTRVVFVPPDFVEVWPERAHPGHAPMAVPEGGVVTFRQPPTLLGLGLLEAVPDAVVRANCDPARAGSSSVAGHATTAFDGRPGRIGLKAHTSSIRDFVASAMTRELGLTNAAIRVSEFRVDGDPVSDPEVAEAVLDDLVAYVQGLAPPPRQGQHPRGEALFEQIGCSDCHMPNPAPGITGAYTDLCVHAMGPAFDTGTPDVGTRADQWRTAPLWGLRFRRAFFHDGRASTLQQTLAQHDGEAAAARQRYQALPLSAQEDLIAFLRTL